MSNPTLVRSVRNLPSGSTRSGICSGGSAGAPSTSTRCKPTRSDGSRRARATASSKAAPRTIRLAAVRMPFVCASSTPSLTSGARPKSSAVTTSALREPLGSLKGSLVRGLASLAQEAEELDALAQAALHHLGAPHHLANDRRDLAAAEVEASIESFHGVEDFGVVQMRIGERSELHPMRVDQLGVSLVEPGVFQRLAVQERSR